MGDRWSYPHQASAATYVWMPLQVDGTKISIPEYWQAWDIRKLKPADALNKGKKLYGGMEVQSKRRRVGDSVQRNSCRYCWRNKPSWRICQSKCIKCRERYCIFFIGRFLQQVSGKSNSNYNTENAEGKLYLTGWSNRNTTGMDRQNKNNLWKWRHFRNDRQCLSLLSYSISYAKGLRYRINHAKDRRNVTLKNLKYNNC
mgnify:CR=1 FL=1